jgi:hypothetical protein
MIYIIQPLKVIKLTEWGREEMVGGGIRGRKDPNNVCTCE